MNDPNQKKSPMETWLRQNKKLAYGVLSGFLALTLVLSVLTAGMQGAMRWLHAPTTLLAIIGVAFVYFLTRDNP